MSKYQQLTQHLKQYKSAIVCFSGGMDSSVMLSAACDALGVDNVSAITYYSCMHPRWELDNAREYAKSLGVKHVQITSQILDINDIVLNRPTRCYYCKRMIYKYLRETAGDNGYRNVLDGCNADDFASFTPGARAAREMGIISPFNDCGVTKKDVTAMADKLKIPQSVRTSYACLASRIPMGEVLTPEKLEMVQRAEECLHKLGYDTVRVRMHDYDARIEIEPRLINRFVTAGDFRTATDSLKKLGFGHVSLDSEGYTP